MIWAPNVGLSKLAQNNRTFLVEYKGAEKVRKAILAADNLLHPLH